MFGFMSSVAGSKKKNSSVNVNSENVERICQLQDKCKNLSVDDLTVCQMSFSPIEFPFALEMKIPSLLNGRIIHV